jgi:hypothetical protein
MRSSTDARSSAVRGERRADNFVPGAHAQRKQRERDRVSAVRHAHAARRADVAGELVLESLHLRAQDVAAAGQHRLDRLAHRLAVRRKTAAGIAHRDVHCAGLRRLNGRAARTRSTASRLKRRNEIQLALGR